MLLQVVFHARIAAERDDGTSFTIADVADGIVAKLVRRQPHVFADVTVSGAEEVKRNWGEIKREKKRALAERRGNTGVGDVNPSAFDGAVRSARSGTGGAAAAPGGAGRGTRGTRAASTRKPNPGSGQLL